MKRVLTVLVCMACVFGLCACSAEKKDKRVEDAIELLCDYYEDYYDEQDIDDKYLKITNTRVVTLEDEFSGELAEKAEEMLGEVSYIVEFQLYTNYYNSSSYYFEYGPCVSVVVYDDGSSEAVTKNLLNQLGTTAYCFDMTGIVKKVEDFDSKYDGELELD